MSYIIPIGPYHPALEEPVHAKLYTEGEVIKDAEVFVGYNRSLSATTTAASRSSPPSATPSRPWSWSSACAVSAPTPTR